MKKLLLIAAAAAVVGFAAPASAQVNIRAGESGVNVRVGSGPHAHRHHRAHRHHHVHRHHRAHRHHHVRGHFARGNCRSVTSRTVTPGGRVIVKTRRVCR